MASRRADLTDSSATLYQQFIEINAIGFRKILKKWDKRSKSSTKELYLQRQVEVQPCFNRQVRSACTGKRMAAAADRSLARSLFCPSLSRGSPISSRPICSTL